MSSQPVETPAVEATPAAAPEVATPAEETPAPATEAPAAESATEDTTAPAAPAEPEVTPIQALYAAANEHGHPEIWGVTLADPDTDVPSQIVFQKYLNANDGSLAKAKEQLLKTLQWRADTKPLELIEQEYTREKFDGLGYVTTYYNDTAAAYKSDEPETKEVFTWNIYGNAKDKVATFGAIDEFIKWRVALMELALQDLSLATATKKITADYDPYKLLQVHDYKSISFLRQSSEVKGASKTTIEVFAQNYPELLKEKFFVNVPAIMGFVYAFMKVFVAAKTIKKFHPMSNGNNLAKELSSSKVVGLGEKLPSEYGGKGEKLSSAQSKQPKLTAAVEVPEETAAAEEASEDAAAEPAAAGEPEKDITSATEPAAPAKEEATA